jgi:hypothetical protein
VEPDEQQAGKAAERLHTGGIRCIVAGGGSDSTRHVG